MSDPLRFESTGPIWTAPTPPDDWFQNVLDFHRKLAPAVIRPLPVIPEGGCDTDYMIGFIEEELAELMRAIAYRDINGVADGLADLIYVTLRASIIAGIDLRPVFAEVHRTNLMKEGGHLRADNKVIKPEGWTPPDIAGVLAKQKPITEVEPNPWPPIQRQG